MRNLKRTLSLFLTALMLASFMEPTAMVYASELQTEPTAQTVEQDISARNGAAPVEGLADAQSSESVQPDSVTQPQADTDSDPKVPPEEPADKPEAPAAHLSGTMVVSADDIIVSYADLYKKGDAVTTKVTISAKIKNDDGPITDWMQRYKTDAPKASINAKVNYPEPGVEPVRNQRDSKADFIQIKETANVSFTKESLGLDTVVRRLKNVTIPVTLEVEVGGSLITIEETATFNIIFTNEPPEAGFTLVTNEMAKIDPDGRFFYVGKTITLTDKASDPEDDLASNEITIKKDGAAVAVIEDGKWLTGGPASKGQAVTNTGVTPDGTFTFQFSDSGTYTIEQEVTDTWGETTREVKTVKVSAAPEAPVSKIKVSSDYSLENETIKVSDVSTDPNDDIVKWEWDEVLIQNADGSTAPAAGNVTGSLKNKGPEDSEDVVPGGELTFSKRGTYVIGLTVTDVLGASNKSTITIKIVDNVPILKITPSNGIVNGKPVVSALTKPLWANAFEKADAFDPHFSAAADLPSGTPTISGAEYLVVKQNRAVYLDTAESFGNGIRDKDTQWIFSDVNGYANFVDQNVVFEDRASNDRHKLFIAKEPGCFQLTVTLHNDYSDELAQSNPNDPSLVARTKTLIVVVVPDEAPEVVLSVINDEVPSFDENPSSITVHVSASAKSVDNDMLAKYEWKVFCDKNNDGDFTNDGTYFQKTGTGLAEIDIPIRFATVAGNYKVQLTVTEAIGQTTITKYLDKAYAKQTTVSSTFNVNWSPTIDFQLADFAYTDDTVRASVKVKDEALATCVVDWELWRSTDSVTFTKVNPSTLPVCSLTASNIEMRIASPGYYMLKATITDAEGHSTSHTANVIRIYDLPQAVISDGAQYRWQNEPWTYKEARKFTLSGMSSRADDIAGKALHEIDHDKDIWSITPLEGQDSSSILVEDLDGTLQTSLDNSYFKMSHKEFNQQLAVLAPGKYQIDYSVVNTYGKRSVPVSQVITIVPDTAPIVSAVVNNPTPVPDANGNMYATFILNFITFKSDDNDYIDDGFYSIKFAYDADNDGDFDDENWQTVRMRDLEFTSATRHEKLAKYSTNQTGLGSYKFSFWAKDTWSEETLDSVPDSARKETTFEVVASVENTAPIGRFTLRKIVAGDVVLSGARSIVRENLQKTSQTYVSEFGGEAGGTKLDMATERIDAGSQNVTGNFPWIKDVDRSIGSINFDPRKSNNVNMAGNPSNAGKNCFYYIDENPNNQKFTFGYSLDFGDNYNAAGMLIGITQSGNNLVGYMLSLNNDETWADGNSGANGCIWKVCWGLGQCSTQFTTSDARYGTGLDIGNGNTPNTRKRIATLNISTSGSLQVEYNGKEITVTQGSYKNTVKLPETFGYGYGFFSDHYHHGCSSIGSFQLTDITLETENWKTLEQICLESTWRAGSERFVIFATDEIEETMQHYSNGTINDDFARLVALLEAQNIHVIVMHSAKNRQQMQEFVNSLTVEAKALQINSISQYNQVLAQATQFIKDVLIKNANTSWWVTVNDKLEYQKFYDDINKDPQWLYTDTNPNWDNPRITNQSQQYQIFWDDPSYLAQYFWYKHNPMAFDNSMGMAPFSESRLNKEITNFSRVGIYSTNYKIKDNPVPNKADNTTENPFDSHRLWSNEYGNDIINELTGEIVNPYQPIYVHRLPVAAFSINASRNATGNISGLTISSSAYDLDHNVSDRARRGLQEYRWTYSDSHGMLHTAYFTDEATGVQWINEMANTIDFAAVKNASIIYQVRDYDGPDTNETANVLVKRNGSWVQTTASIPKDGAWSEPNYVWLADGNVAPIALFETDKSTYDLGERIQITDYSYSPCFDTLTRWTWTVKRVTNDAEAFGPFTDNNIASAQQRIFQWIDGRQLELSDEDNTYTITLMVTDAHGRESPEFSKKIVISPSNNPPTVTGNTGTALKHNNPTIYEYDPYDENLTNPYYNNEKRGLENLALGLDIQDIDNTDKYGPANNSNRFKVQYMFERFTTKTRQEMAANEATLSPVKAVTYPVRTVSAAQAKDSTRVLPFRYFKDNGKGLTWGNYRITMYVTDIPNNGKPGSTAQYETNPRTVALDLYVIPKLFLDDAEHAIEMFFNGQPYELTMEVIPGENLEITAVTGAESIGTRIIYPDGLGGTLTQEMTPVKVTKDSIKWQAIWTLPDDVEEDDLDANSFYYFDIQTYTNYGNRSGEETRVKTANRHIKVLPIKLYDFNITGVTDPSVTFTAAPSGDTNPPIFVRNMAMDLNNAESLMKLSYAFEFEITSKGMKKDNDHVVLEPVFYGWDGTAYNDELDMYYISNDKYVKLGDTSDTYGIYTSAEDDSIYLGFLSQLTLPIECRTFVDRATQKWTGRYGLPGSAVFVKKGVPLSEEALYHTDEQGHGVLIAFNIYATKEGVSKYNYVAKGQWTKEFFQNEGTGAIINLQKQIYNQPWVTATYHIPTIVVNGDANALSNYETRPVWTK